MPRQPSDPPVNLESVTAQLATSQDDAPRQAPPPAPRRPTPATYQLRVELAEVRPLIWRTMEVPSDLRLNDLHTALQITMGWQNCHLHAFNRWDTAHGFVEPAFLTELDVAEGGVGVPETAVTLDEVLAEPGDLLQYHYDFGDGWEHTVRLEAVLTRSDDSPDARCTGGARACPPEDCGGPWGYEELQTSLGQAAEAFSPDIANRIFASGIAAADLDTTGLPPLVTGLLGRLPSEVALAVHDLAREALPHGALTPAPTPEELEALTRDVRFLLDQIGEDGVTLTAAGYLPTTLVRATYEALDLRKEWPRPSNRESEVRPVLSLRLSLQDLGLLRKAKGRLLLTVAGRKLRTDPARLVRHVASRLPLATDDFERISGTFTLLALAAGRRSDDEDVVELSATVLNELGWRIGDRPVEPHDVVSAASRTREVLARSGVVVWSRLSQREPPAQSPAAVSFVRSTLTGASA